MELATVIAIRMPSEVRHKADWSRFGEPWDKKGPQMAEVVRAQIRSDLIAKLEREAAWRTSVNLTA